MKSELYQPISEETKQQEEMLEKLAANELLSSLVEVARVSRTHQHLRLAESEFELSW